MSLFNIKILLRVRMNFVLLSVNTAVIFVFISTLHIQIPNQNLTQHTT